MAEKFSETVSFDVSKKHAPTALGDVLVLGLGKSGKAASTYFAKQLGSRVASLTNMQALLLRRLRILLKVLPLRVR